ncbi:MAG TPA: biotin--[acetyl-CoA-carboxylase] ligase [Steroidobacteraceae bacterium]|jgi:BirA family biotin operon repressor/biotin-[acetyl-CoA-carboxylase] ligase|nr:biotin--[acetyl-CoA-carboxylase] ligase [Steroidobacteraceae bacterium]
MTTAVQGGDAAGEELPLVARVFTELADGEFHSGEQLAEKLGVSRSAVWKAVESLRELGATLHAVRNKGYRLRSGSDALASTRISALLPPTVRAHIRRVDTAWTVDSTNSMLLARPIPPFGTGEVLLAEYQTAGRGRRGRAWVAPPGGSICLSLSWAFREVSQDLGALGLVIGVCALRALRESGVEEARLKWPNDLLVAGKKLGGILIELRAESDGPAFVVIGIGLNVALGAKLLERIGESGVVPTDLASTGLKQPSRNALAATLVAEVVRGLLVFEQQGLRPFAEEWGAADALRGRQVDVHTLEGVARGLARGIDLHGALVVETPNGVRRFISGDVTVRAAE